MTSLSDEDREYLGDVWDAETTDSAAAFYPAVEHIIANHLQGIVADLECRVEAWIRHGQSEPIDSTTYDRETVHQDLRDIVSDLRARCRPGAPTAS